VHVYLITRTLSIVCGVFVGYLAPTLAVVLVFARLLLLLGRRAKELFEDFILPRPLIIRCAFWILASGRGKKLVCHIL